MNGIQQVLIAWAVLILAAALVFHYRRKSFIKTFGLDWGTFRKRDNLVYFLAFLAIAILWNEISVKILLAGPHEPEDIQKTMAIIKDFPGRIWLTIYLVIVAPFCEELIFRGFFYRFTQYLFPRIYHIRSNLLAMIPSAFVFAGGHGGSYSYLIPLFGFACLYTVAYEVTGSLFVPIIIHAAINVFNALPDLWSDG
jgi:membrane protease YdiL (CAAX protease family)